MCTVTDEESLEELSQICEDHNQSTCEHQARQRGLFVVGRGGGRTVFAEEHDIGFGFEEEDATSPISGSCVVKIPTQDFGKKSNLTEKRVWNKVENTEAEDIFAEVYDTDEGGDWLAMHYYPTEGERCAFSPFCWDYIDF